MASMVKLKLLFICPMPKKHLRLPDEHERLMDHIPIEALSKLACDEAIREGGPQELLVWKNLD
jgi:hypothetical protein